MSLSVLFVHNRYQERGGEDSVFEAESALLEAHGHRIERLVFDNKDLPKGRSPGTLLRIAANTVWSKQAQQRLQLAINDFKPNVVHFHNTLPQVSPAAYGVARRNGAVVVQTLHNFRLVCPSGLMYRDGKPCESCVGDAVPLAGVLHGCYRGSRAQTATVATMLAVHRARGTWEHDVDLYLSPSEFLKSKVVEGGISPDKILVKPNFVSPDPGPGPHHYPNVLFVGRLTETKGIDTLLQAYERNACDLPPLRIAGDGDLAPRVREAAENDPRIVYLGPLSKEAVVEEMGRARALVFPSVWYENFPVTIVEAFARGLPVIASRLGALPEIVKESVSGALFRAGDADDLASKLLDVREKAGHFATMGRSARETYLARYSGERAYEQLLNAYLTAGRKPVALLKQTSEAHVISR